MRARQRLGVDTIAGGIRLVSVLVLVLLVVTASVGWRSAANMTDSIRRIMREYRDDASLTSQFTTAVAAGLNAGTTFIMTQDTVAEARFRALTDRARTIHLRLDRKMGRTPEEASLIAEIQNRLGSIEAHYSTAHRLVQLGRAREAEGEASQSRQVAEEMLAAVDRLTAMQTRKIDLVSARLQEETSRRAWSFGLLLAGLVMLAVIAGRQASHLIATPLAQLARHATRLSDGAFDARTDAAGLPGEFRVLAGSMNDASESLARLARIEAVLRESQKVEAVGRLAGGVAHDFNNILSAIMMNVDLQLMRLGEDAESRNDLTEIKGAATKAALLTRQLLAFSSRQVLQPTVLDLNDMVRGTLSMLRRVIGADVELATMLDSRPCMVRVDAGQLEQVLVNFAINARDAMPAGGTLSIEVRRNESLSHGAAPEPGSGSQVTMRVRDTGTGIAAASLPHIFEPFYTTKSVGKGTGLGLAMVQGIIRQSGGQIAVESEEGTGTTFTITLPLTDAPPSGVTAPTPRRTAAGTATILLVEDTEAVRASARRMLERSGYTVLEAQNGVEAIRIFERRSGEIRLILTDLVMPLLGGREMVRRLAPALARAGTHVVYMSGYSADSEVLDGRLDGAAFLAKPFTMDELLFTVSDALAGHTTMPGER